MCPTISVPIFLYDGIIINNSLSTCLTNTTQVIKILLQTNFFAASCSAPTNIANGRVKYLILKDGHYHSYEIGYPVNGVVPYDTRVYVTCNEGYIPTHTQRTGCILDADWNIPIATCTGN